MQEETFEIEKEHKTETSRLVKSVLAAVFLGATILPLTGCYEYNYYPHRSYGSPRRTVITRPTQRYHNTPNRHFRAPRRHHNPYRKSRPNPYRRHRR